MATKKSKNYNLTLQDNDEFVDIETTAANFENLDTVIKEIDDKLAENGEALKDLQANGYSHPKYTARASGLYKITVDETGHVSDVAKATKSDITALGIPGVNTVYSHPTYTARSTRLYKITVDGLGHVSTVSAVTKEDITALGIPGSDTIYSHPTYTARASGLYKVTVDGTGHVSGASAVTKNDITALGIPASDTTYSNATTSTAGLMSAADKVKVNKIDGLSADVASLKAFSGVGSEVLSNESFINMNSTTSNYKISNLDKYKMVLVQPDKAINSPILASVSSNGEYYFISGGYSYFWDYNDDEVIEETKVSYFASVRVSSGQVYVSHYYDSRGFYGSVEIIGLF